VIFAIYAVTLLYKSSVIVARGDNPSRFDTFGFGLETFWKLTETTFLALTSVVNTMKTAATRNPLLGIVDFIFETPREIVAIGAKTKFRMRRGFASWIRRAIIFQLELGDRQGCKLLEAQLLRSSG
jgi:hypothetical protein